MPIIPLRSFIHDRLYHSTEGYFCKESVQLGELSRSLNFKSMIGYDDYKRQLSAAYPPHAWLTPSQIFRPYYGMTMARYIIRTMEKYPQSRLSITQVGAGTGTAAESILFYIQNYAHAYLSRLQYTIVQISPTLCERIGNKLHKSYPKLMKNKTIQIINGDILNYKCKTPTFVCLFQVLDNMPHDKVIYDGGQYTKYVGVNTQTKKQIHLPIQNDPLIEQCLQLYLSRPPCKETKQSLLDRIAGGILRMTTQPNTSKDIFLPTHFLQVMRKLSQNAPQSHFIVNDFHSLPSRIPGINAPVVSFKGKKNSEKIDYDTYLVNRGEADIFFPIDFGLLDAMHTKYFKKAVHIVPTHEFMSEFGQNEWASTQSGYNPIRQDFANTTILVSKV